MHRPILCQPCIYASLSPWKYISRTLTHRQGYDSMRTWGVKSIIFSFSVWSWGRFIGGKNTGYTLFFSNTASSFFETTQLCSPTSLRSSHKMCLREFFPFAFSQSAQVCLKLFSKHMCGKAWRYFPFEPNDKKNTTCVQNIFSYSRFECRELYRWWLYIRLHVFSYSRDADTVLLAEYYCCISLPCDYNKNFQTNMILICVTRMMVLYFLRKVLQCAELRDILFSWSIAFMCVSYWTLSDIINTL